MLNNSNNKVANPHDKFFRSMMTEPKVIREFFEQNLPANIRSTINFDSIAPQQDSFIDDHLRLQIADLLYSAEFGEQQGYLYLLVEHQSTPYKLMAFRVLKYMVAIMEKHVAQTKTSKLPIVYPIVIYNGWKNYKHSTDIFDLFGDKKELAQDILWKPYQLIDLSTISDDKLKESLWYGIAAYVMKHIFEKDFLPALKDIINNLKDIETQGEMSYIYTTLSYIVEASEIEKEDFINTVKTGLSAINEEKIMTLAEQFRQEGVQAGKQLGIQEGIQKGYHKGQLEKINALKNISMKLLNQGMDPSQISTVTGLSIEEICSLKNKTTH